MRWHSDEGRLGSVLWGGCCSGGNGVVGVFLKEFIGAQVRFDEN